MNAYRYFAGFTLFLISFTASHAQVNTSHIADSITYEGKLLYRSEQASWLGTDIFLERCPNKRADIGGYFSYTDKDQARCVFFSKDDIPQALATVTFDSSYTSRYTLVDTSSRKLTDKERILCTIRQNALAEINRDTLFRRYNNTDLNLIPLISFGKRKVYVLTGPKDNGVIIFGNDYLLTYDENNRLLSKEQLHRNILTVSIGHEGAADSSVGGVHSHVLPTSPFFTPTDICTLMLYEKFTKWTTYTVVSKDYFSFWDCGKDQFVILNKKAVDKINKDQKKRHPKN